MVSSMFYGNIQYYNDGLDFHDKAEIKEWLIERIHERTFTA